ncbi:MAG TPA: PPE domain-containing protein [Pseudonocardiaceae bacterium]|jgi:hypothetical protein|nr:PPE domain-containing protein [Pseudonocardiaceae bacterium]
MGNTLYDQFHTSVKGVGPLNNATDSLNRLQTTYENVRDNLTQALSGIKTTYTGNAADAMSDAFTPLADSFNDGANFAGSAALSTSFQAESFATAQAKIANQVPVPAAPFYEAIDPFSTDHDNAVNQNSQIDSTNEAAYNAYGSDTSGNLGYVQPAPTATSGFGTFSVAQQGGSKTVGSPSGSAGSSGSGSGGRGSSGSVSNSRYTAGGQSGYVAPPSGTSQSSPPPSGSGSGAIPPGQTSTSGWTPPPSNPGSGSGIGTPGGGMPIGVGDGPGGTGGGQFGGSGPGSVIGPLGGAGGDFSTGGGGSLGGGSLGGGSGSSLGRGGFGPTGSGEPGAGGSGAGSARSGVGSTAGIGEEAEMEGGAAGAAGRSGASGMGGGMGGRGGRGGEDDEHKTASYLTNEDNGSLIVGDFDPVSPRVIGE